jgi:hypothetical protein
MKKASLVFTTLALTFFVASVCTAQSYFHPAVQYQATVAPYTVGIGDLDADGAPDLVTTDYFGDSITVHLGRGDGTFLPRTSTWVGCSAFDLGIADVTGDGLTDVVVITSCGFVVLCVGDGEGGFSDTQFPVFSPTVFGGGAMGRFNDDLNWDLVASNDGDPGAVYVMLGNGDGSFGSPISYSVPKGPSDVSLADFNGDGTTDIAVVSSVCCPLESAISVLLGNGDGTFGASISVPPCDDPRSVEAGDLNSDGKKDLVVGCTNGQVAIRLGVGDGSFLSGSDLLTGSSAWGLALGDFSRDGMLDVSVAAQRLGSPDSVVTFQGLGDGLFGQRRANAVHEGAWGVTAGDLDVDGHMDLAVANTGGPGGGGPVSVLLNCAGCGTTAISAALESANVDEGVVHLRWIVSGSSTQAAAYRRTAGSDWTYLGQATDDPGSYVSYQDRSPEAGTRNAYRIQIQDGSEQGYSDEVWILVPNGAGTPQALHLDPVFPNPLEREARFNFAVPRAGRVRLEIFSVTGQRVATIVNQDVPGGWRLLTWNGRDTSGQLVASGTYFARLESAGEVRLRKVVVAR